MTLVITSKAPDEGGCLRMVGTLVRELAADGEEVHVLCYADAVYNLLAGSRQFGEFGPLPATFNAVDADVAARGIAGKLSTAVKRLDYGAVVDLVFAADRVVSCA